jgi:hypothetical protein
MVPTFFGDLLNGVFVRSQQGELKKPLKTFCGKSMSKTFGQKS